MRYWLGLLSLTGILLLGSTRLMAANPSPDTAAPAAQPPHWTPAGWGGGGFFYSTAFSPDGKVIYLGGDVAGCYKSLDHGKTWQFINNGIAAYGVFALAVDPSHPNTVYASTDHGLCKSTDQGDHWQVLPHTAPDDLRITGEKNRSFRSVAVDPANGNVLYAASPTGKLYKSADAGQTWAQIYEKTFQAEPGDYLRTQFGKVNGAIFGGFWSPVKPVQGVQAADCAGFGFTAKGNGVKPDKAYLNIRTESGAAYLSKNLRDAFADGQWTDVIVKPEDFQLDPVYVKQHPRQAATLPAKPDLTKVTRFDLACVGSLENAQATLLVQRFFLAVRQPAQAADQPPTLQTVLDFTQKKTLPVYGNARTGPQKPGTIYTVAVCPADPACVVAATEDAGLVMSDDAGKTWRELNTPKKAASVFFAGQDARTLYASFFADGVYKSADRGATWTAVTPHADDQTDFLEITANPANANDVYVIAHKAWDGKFFYSHDGGQSWTSSSLLNVDLKANPTVPLDCTAGTNPFSNPRNLAINPRDPNELFIAANWRPAVSHDAGKTWTESDRGADISCVTDIRFSKDGQRTYATAMDEGTLVSDDQGENWKQLWPLKYKETNGHGWRLDVQEVNGHERIINTFSPWATKYPNHVILSEDGGKTHQNITEGLLDYVPTANTMWGRSYPRALAADPNNPDILYLGMDGNATNGKPGGGLFKSTDGGKTWAQLAHQPGSRRMFYGLAVDPTDSNRLYWGACGAGGGLYCSEDAGATWKHVFKTESWVFNVLVTADGTVYCPGRQLWRSTDHGKTWKKLTNLKNGWTIVGLEADPANPKTLWFSAVTWGQTGAGGIYKTTDGGTTWQDITGDIGYRKPLVLRYNPVTHELWTGYVGLFKIKQ